MTLDEYVRRFEWALRDLPWKMQRELVAELRAHIAELELGQGLEKRLGYPESYASDLRAAAELGPRRGPVAYARSRRPRRVVAGSLVVAAVITAVGLGIGSLVWIESYQPLALANHYLYPPGKQLTGLDGVQAGFHAGKRFEFGISIVNNGRFSVRLLGVPWGYRSNPWNARLLMSPVMPNTGETIGPDVPFHPIDLPPNGVIFVFYKGVYACHAPEDAGALIYTYFPVRWSFLWRTTTTEIPLDEPLAILFTGARGRGCK